jgi:hypothetical protein
MDIGFDITLMDYLPLSPPRCHRNFPAYFPMQNVLKMEPGKFSIAV